MKQFVLVGLIWFVAEPACAWEQEGHSIVAEVAERKLARDATAITSKIEEILGPGVSMASVAMWADDYKWQCPVTQRWHFVHIPIDADNYDSSTQCVVSPKEGDCIIAELERLKFQVRCAKGDEQKNALKFAIHFVGDLHQPLHTVKEEEGGRKSKVEVSFIGERCPKCPITTTSENLSVVWNSTLINKTVWNWQSYVTRLENGWLKDHDVRGDGVDGDGPVQWAVQTHKVAQRIWKLTPESKKLDDNYYRAVLPLLDQQLGLASLRLTRFLEDALGSDNCPELTHAVGSDKECPAPGFGNALTGQ